MTSVGVMASAVNLAAGTDVLMEPFNNLSAWTVTGTPTIVTGRTGTAAQFTWNSGADQADYRIPSGAQSDTMTLGFAWRPNPDTTHSRPFMRLMSDSGATEHALLFMNSDGSFEYRVSSVAKYRSAAGFLVANTFYYIEVQTKMHDTAGTIIIRVNGTEVLNLTGQDTKAAGTKTVWDTVRLGPPTVFNGSDLFDDLYITTGAGAPFKGSITIP